MNLNSHYQQISLFLQGSNYWIQYGTKSPKPCNRDDILGEMLWGNKDFTIKKGQDKSLLFRSWTDANFTQVKHLNIENDKIDSTFIL